MTDHVFAYGSLVREHPGAPAALLRGAARWWGVAMDNSADIPGYKHYRDATGRRPAVHVAFLDLRSAPGVEIAGVLVPVDDAVLAALDARERNYVRTEVTASIGGTDVAGRVWTYVGTPGGRARLVAAKAAGAAVVHRQYVERVEAGYDALGDGSLDAFRATTDPHDLPLADLERVETRPVGPRVRRSSAGPPRRARPAR